MKQTIVSSNYPPLAMRKLDQKQRHVSAQLSGEWPFLNSASTATQARAAMRTPANRRCMTPMLSDQRCCNFQPVRPGQVAGHVYRVLSKVRSFCLPFIMFTWKETISSCPKKQSELWIGVCFTRSWALEIGLSGSPQATMYSVHSKLILVLYMNKHCD